MTKKIKGAHIVLWGLLIGGLGGGVLLSLQADRRQYGTRTMSTPAQRLVGQWQVLESGGRMAERYYFGPLGEEGFGAFYIVGQNGLVFHHRYEVVKQKQRGRYLRIRHFLSSRQSRTEDVDVAMSGLTARHTQVFFGSLRTRSMRYIDDAVVPAEVLAAKEPATVTPFAK